MAIRYPPADILASNLWMTLGGLGSSVRPPPKCSRSAPGNNQLTLIHLKLFLKN